MKAKSVLLKCDVWIDNFEATTAYRLYVANDLFAERTWIWTDHYLEENIAITAKPGRYPVRIELVQPSWANLDVRNLRLANSDQPAVIHSDNTVEILA